MRFCRVRLAHRNDVGTPGITFSAKNSSRLIIVRCRSHSRKMAQFSRCRCSNFVSLSLATDPEIVIAS